MAEMREKVKQEDKVVKEQTKHHSQTDAAKGFGGKYGVQKERVDKVLCVCVCVCGVCVCERERERERVRERESVCVCLQKEKGVLYPPPPPSSRVQLVGTTRPSYPSMGHRQMPPRASEGDMACKKRELIRQEQNSMYSLFTV